MFFIFKIARFRRPWLIGGRPARKIAAAKKPADAAASSYSRRWGHIFAGRVVAVGGKLTATATSKVRAGAAAEARKADNMVNRKPLISG